MVERVVNVDVVADDTAGDAPGGPLVACPFCLAEILAREVRTRGVVSAPFFREGGVGGGAEDGLEGVVAEAGGGWPGCVWEVERRGGRGEIEVRGLGLVVAEEVALAGDGDAEEDDGEREQRDRRQGDCAEASDLAIIHGHVSLSKTRLPPPDNASPLSYAEEVHVYLTMEFENLCLGSSTSTRTSSGPRSFLVP